APLFLAVGGVLACYGIISFRSTEDHFLRLVRGDIERIVDESERALIAADRGLYQRDGLIVNVVAAPVIAAGGHEITAQRIGECGDYALLEHLACAAHFTKYDKRERSDVAADPPVWIVKTMRERKEKRFPILTGVISAPTMRRDGSIIDRPGYDLATGLLFDAQGVEFPSIPDRPTREEARAALALLENLIATFPFVGDVDRAVALSAIVTAPVRRSLPSVPMHAFSSPVAGSGKSMLVDLCSVITTGHEAGVIAQGKSAEEMEKRLGSALLAGDTVIAIDNCEAPLGGDLLCQTLTQPVVKTRVLGLSKTPTLSTGAFVTATGNNLVLVGDVTRRSLLSCLDPKCERPETRVFVSNPCQVAKANRPALVGAALTILRAFHIAGRQYTKAPPLGSFEEWSSLVRGALLWLGCADPVDSMDAVRTSDPKLSHLRAVAEQWRAVIGPEGVTAADVIKRATERPGRNGEPADFDHAEFREVLIIVAGDKGAINGRRLGKWLAEAAGRIVDGRRFTHCGTRQGVRVWALETL
ncbi:MAG TPA: hypothetical protein VEH77_02225, partial [Roseiarcus sp.]|nr:hypothetical protein [Roseiarcus sp.]